MRIYEQERTQQIMMQARYMFLFVAFARHSLIGISLLEFYLSSAPQETLTKILLYDIFLQAQNHRKEVHSVEKQDIQEFEISDSADPEGKVIKGSMGKSILQYPSLAAAVRKANACGWTVTQILITDTREFGIDDGTYTYPKKFALLYTVQ